MGMEPTVRTYIRPVYLGVGQWGSGSTPPVLERWDVMVGDRNVGSLNPERTIFRTERDELRHFARLCEGYGIEATIVDCLFAPEGPVERVALVVKHSDGRQREYEAPSTVWILDGVRRQLSENFGLQVFLRFDRIVGVDARIRAQLNSFPSSPQARVSGPIPA